MEWLSFNSGSQWTLHKSATPPYSTNAGSESQNEQGYAGDKFRAYRSTTGQLRADYDTKGEMHGNPGNKRAPKQGQAKRNWGKPSQNLPSAAANQDPGMGI